MGQVTKLLKVITSECLSKVKDDDPVEAKEDAAIAVESERGGEAEENDKKE